MFNFFLLKKIERRYRCYKLSAFTATEDGSNVEPRVYHRFLTHGGESVRERVVRATTDASKVKPRARRFENTVHQILQNFLMSRGYKQFVNKGLHKF